MAAAITTTGDTDVGYFNSLVRPKALRVSERPMGGGLTLALYSELTGFFCGRDTGILMRES